MRRDDLELEVHDYLDGRLSATARRAFEERLEADPELARRLQAYRAAGRALREDPIELPVGFYARARARFEARRPARSWGRLVSWEAVGLAAATLLLVAILFPQVWEDRRLSRPAASKIAPAVEESLGREEPNVAPVLPQPKESRKEAPQVTDADRPAPSGPVPDELDKSAAGRGTEDEALKSVVRRDVLEDKKAVENDDAFAPAPARQAEPGSWGSPLPEGVFVDGPVQRRSRASGDRDERLMIVIVDQDSWERTLGKLGTDVEREALTPDFAQYRLVLIGPEPHPVDCRTWRWRRVGQRIVIESVPAVSASVPSRKGCAIRIPAGDEPVELRSRED